MDADNLHLLLNYYPIIVTSISLVVLVMGLAKASDKVKRAGLSISCAAAVLALPVYVSGEITGSEMARGMFGDLIREHKRSALVAFASIEATGIVALIGLIVRHRRQTAARWLVLAVTGLSLISFVLLAQTTLMGRRIKFGPANDGFKPPVSFRDGPIQKSQEKKIWLA